MERIDHIAIVVNNINRAIEWYTTYRDCEVKYKDNTYAILKFENIDLALVLPHEHPPHIAFEDSIVGGQVHRDESKYLYDHDTFGNIIEKIEYKKNKG